MSTSLLPFWGMPSVTNKFHSINIEMINYCANNCIFCYCKNKIKTHKIMSIENLTKLLQNFPNFDGDVTLSDTGDPILLADLDKRISLIKEYWPHCHINMTTTLIVQRPQEYFKKVFNAGLDQISLSCYAFTVYDYRKIHGSRHFDNVLTNLKNLSLLDNKFKDMLVLKTPQGVNTSYPVTDYGQKKREFMHFFRELGFSRTYDECSIVPVNLELNTEENNFWKLPIPCSVVWGFLAGSCEVHADLDAVPCCLFPDESYTFGNFHSNNVEEIYTSTAAKKFRQSWWDMDYKKIPICRHCKNYTTRVSNMEEFTKIIFWQAEQLREKEVIFVGNGTAYRRYCGFFSKCKPIAMINSVTTERESIHPNDFSIFEKPESASVPIVIFAYADEAKKILKTLNNKYSVSVKNIYVCPPMYIMENGEPYDI